MISFTPDFSSLTRFANLFSAAGGRTAQTVSKVDVQSQTQTGLSIVTAEGDKVTLSTHSSFQGTGVKYNARGVAEGQAISLRSNLLEGEFSKEKQIAIEGDLNEQEIQDIKKIVKQVNGLRHDVTSGNLNAAFAHGQQISASGTIASVDVNIQHAESVSLSRTVLRQTSGGTSSRPEDVANVEQGTTRSPTPQLGFLEGLFAPKVFNKPVKGSEQNTGNSTKPESQHTESSQEPKRGSFLDRLREDAKQTVHSLSEFLNKVGEKILKSAQKIARLASKLKERVERQAEKIAQAYEKLSEAVDDGKVKKAERLQNKIERRLNRLEDTTERIGTRIEKATHKLTNFVDSLTERLTQSGFPQGDPPTHTPSERTEPSSGTEQSQTVFKQIGDP